ncbi:MAG TPA: hypothetical protein VG273_12755 [Bryobacteraceae bacterium]|jgi:hypothetical protein|nr:hypothetical protein [Bryobacteraceae bacterium]
MYETIPHLSASISQSAALRLEWRTGGPVLAARDRFLERPLRDLGLPDDLRELREEPDPSPLAALISDVLPAELPEFYLFIDTATPWLAVLPWEDAAPNMPLRRLSRFSMPPGNRKRDHAAALTSGVPADHVLFTALAINSFPSVTHLTLDPEHYVYGSNAANYVDRLICPPFEAAARSRVRAPLQNAVLRWSLGALPRPADVVQFLAPLVYAGVEPALALRYGRRTEVATASEIAFFAAHAGAWRVTIMTSDPADLPLARMLAHRISEAGPLSCAVDPPGETRSTLYTTPLKAINAESFLERYTLIDQLRSSDAAAQQRLQPAQRLLERYAAECFEHVTERAFQNREPGAAWQGMLEGIADVRDEFIRSSEPEEVR